MPVFNKEEYWKRRHNVEKIKEHTGIVENGKPKTKTVKRAVPLRGQGDEPVLGRMAKFEAPKGGEPRRWRRSGARVKIIPEHTLCTEPKCMFEADRDNLCNAHWAFYFAGLTNKQRMQAKQQLRDFRKKVADHEKEPANATTNKG